MNTGREVDVTLIRTESGVALMRGGCHVRLEETWDALMQMNIVHGFLVRHPTRLERWAEEPQTLAPVAGQEVWAAGVTYLRSRTARMEESRDAGGGSFYDRAYDAPRPELYFKAQGWRARGPGETTCVSGTMRGGASPSRRSRSVQTRAGALSATQSGTT
jgi:2-dehydro-3-deoxy-D-arabinonate dehydratase